MSLVDQRDLLLDPTIRKMLMKRWDIIEQRGCLYKRVGNQLKVLVFEEGGEDVHNMA